jgi:hypothetical protein
MITQRYGILGMAAASSVKAAGTVMSIAGMRNTILTVQSYAKQKILICPYKKNGTAHTKSPLERMSTPVSLLIFS